MAMLLNFNSFHQFKKHKLCCPLIPLKIQFFTCCVKQRKHYPSFQISCDYIQELVQKFDPKSQLKKPLPHQVLGTLTLLFTLMNSIKSSSKAGNLLGTLNRSKSLGNISPEDWAMSSMLYAEMMVEKYMLFTMSVGIVPLLLFQEVGKALALFVHTMGGHMDWMEHF